MTLITISNPMGLKNLLFVTLVISVFQQTTAQRNYEEYNRLGINLGLTLFDIETDDFTTEQGTGYMGGFTTRGSFRNNFDLIYGLNFYQSEVGILGRFIDPVAATIDEQYVDYTIQAAQLNFLASYNIIKHHLSIELGPVLNINGRMKLKRDGFENYILDGYNTLRAEEIQDISRVNFRVAGGITAGLEKFRVTAHYQYGVTNMFNKLNDQSLEKDNFEGHSGTLTLAAVLYF